MSRLWLALVLVLFCAPLFVNLRSLDLETDEAIYSFAVDDILADGQWLQPKSSPSDTVVFLEKPPLKFWIVAAPIRLGLLPHDEFGLRFWDAVFGTASFVYVFLVGTLLAGPICGAVAVLTLFVHAPLVFEHGLRTNNMEAALLLSYCGGIFHFLRWQAGAPRFGAHALAAGLFFVLGFMTKFVAVAFLPFVLLVGSLLFRRERRQLLLGWTAWARVAAVVIALIVPWFAYAWIKFGNLFWETILAEHVYARFTASLNPEHVQPWNFYLLTAWRQFQDARIEWLVAAGMVLLAVQSARRHWFEGTVVTLWAAIPVVLISLGSSKLYHYAYPFLPPFALGAGYLVALALMLAPVQVRKLAEWLEDGWMRAAPHVARALERGALRRVLTLLIWAALLVAVVTAFTGGVRVTIGRDTIFRSSGLLRPLLAVAILAVAARRSASYAVAIVAIAIVALLPLGAYAENVKRLTVHKHPMRDASECVARVQGAHGDLPRGMFVDTNKGIWHPINYYFRRIQPWIRQEQSSPESLERMLKAPSALRPSLVEEGRYRDYRSGPDAARFSVPTSPPMIGLNGYALLLPGPYSSCSPEASLVPVR